MHGGTIEPLYNGSNLAASNDFIVVSFNYRLNIFGFMHFETVYSLLEDSGYLGLKDQIAALQWIKENIAEFDGNPDNITIFGKSAGSMSTMLLTLVPDSKNLFQKIISQSGNVSFYNEPENSAQIAENFMKFSGAKTVGDLMKKSAVELQQLYSKYLYVSDGSNLSDFSPACDGKFFALRPFYSHKNGAAREIKFLTGVNTCEWSYWLLYDENYFKNFYEINDKISLVMSRYKSRIQRRSEKSKKQRRIRQNL